MSVRKFITKSGAVKWELELYAHGRGSQRMRRRFDTKSEAQAFLDEYSGRKRKQKKAGYGVRDFEETTFGAEAEYWLRHRSKEFSAGHLKRARGVLDEVLPEFENLSPIRVQPELLSEFQNRQLALGLRPATVNRKTEVITAILAFAVKHRRIPFNPSAGFQKLKSVRNGVGFWERHEAEALLAFADRKYPKGNPDRWVYVVYLVALNTALRAGEIWGLQPQDIVQGGDLLYVQRQYDRVEKSFGPLKWRMPPRNVPCNEELASELSAVIAAGNVSRTNAIFQGPEGRPVCHEVFAKGKFQADVKEAGLRRIRFHDLRHTATTLMIADGVDVNTAKEICGHKSLKTTMDYAHLLGGAVKRVAKAFGVSANKRLFEPPKAPEPPKAQLPSHVAQKRTERPRLVLVR